MSEELRFLEKISSYLEFLAKREAQKLLLEELSDSSKKKLYELTGKNIPVSEISKQIEMSTGAISLAWQKWCSLGIIKKVGGKYIKIFDDI